MTDCLFCKFVSGQIKPNTVHDDADYLAFRDINPQAPTHVLIVPKRHIASLNDLTAADNALVGGMFTLAAQVAKKEGIAAGGYRTVFNCGPNAQQSVFHIHLHVMGGRPFTWPPG